MGTLGLTIRFAVLLCVAHTVISESKLTLTDKVDTEGYHATCHASKPGHKEGFKQWKHSFEDCSKRGNTENFSPLLQDKHTKIAYSENEAEFLTTVTQVGSRGEEIAGQNHCVCCVIEANSICFNLTMQHDHQHHDHHHHHHH